MFYRPGGTSKAPNRQYDLVYADFIGGATDWLPVARGNTIAVNICRSSIVFGSAAASVLTNNAVAPEAQIILELKMFGGDPDSAAFPVDQWQNLVVATDRRAHRDGWVRLRVVNVNNSDSTGVALALQISRTGDNGAVT
jgi:hypothetical protein